MDAAPRASDADREAAAEQLRHAMGDGRLTVEELEDRLEAAYRARTRPELDRLLADVPAGAELSPADLPGRVPVRPGPGGTSWVVSVMSGNERRGRWRLAPRCQVVNLMGSSDLDLSAVELAAQHVELTVLSVMGASRITVPESLNVEVSKVALMGGHDVDLGSAPTDPSGPVLHVRFVSIMGGGELRRTGAAFAELSGRRRRGRRRRRVGRRLR